MAYLSMPTRCGSIFQRDKSASKIFERNRALKTEEYINRRTRRSFADDREHVRLNIGGKLFKTRKSTLRNVLGTKLSKLDETCENYDSANREYFFDRNPLIFAYILDYYRTGDMHIPRGVCSTAIREELKFWELGEGCISNCCRKVYFEGLDDNATYELIKEEFLNLSSNFQTSKCELTIKSRFQEFRRRAWEFMDNHESSLQAKIYALVYYGLIVITVGNLFVASIPSIRLPIRKHVLIRSSDDTPPVYNYGNNITGTLKTALTTDPPDWSVMIDFICLQFFTLDFLLRMSVCPSIKEYMKSWHALLDILYLLPAWIKLIIDLSSPFFWQNHSSHANMLVALDAMIVLRVIRIFRVFRHYRGLWVLLLAIKASVSELMLLVVFVVFSLTVYASLVFCVEQYNTDTNSGSDPFYSMFTGLWWALITLATVGYGDTYPMTVLGRIIACLCAITGLLIIGMVVPILAGNFMLYYGFRHAGCENIALHKPEFVPTEEENPLPDLDEYEKYWPKEEGSSVASNSEVLMLLRLSRSRALVAKNSNTVNEHSVPEMTVVDTDSTIVPEITNTELTIVPEIRNTELTIVPKIRNTESTIVPEIRNTESTIVPEIRNTELTIVPEIRNTELTIVPEIRNTESTIVPEIRNTESTIVPEIRNTESTTFPEIRKELTE